MNPELLKFLYDHKATIIKTIILIVTMIGIAASSAAIAHKIDAAAYAEKLKTEIAAQKNVDELACNAKIQLKDEASREFQNTISTLGVRIDQLKRMQQPAACKPVMRPAPARPVTAAATGGGYADGNGIRSEWLIDFAGRCERYRQQLIGLQKFNVAAGKFNQ